MNEHMEGRSTHLAHLTDQQFADCALMTPDAATRAHLASCETCRAELESFGASVDAFEGATIAWSESQPRPSLRAVVQAKPRNLFIAPAAWALAAAAAFAVGVPAWQHAHPGSTANTAAVASVVPDSSAQIADDNQLMQQVNVALASEDPSPLAEYRLSGPGETHHKSRLESSYR